MPYFPRRPIKLDYIYFHTGRFVYFWACAEDALDACLRFFEKAFPDPLYQRPLSTKRRIAVFRASIKKGRFTDAQRATALDLIDRFAAVAQHRQWAVHGVTWGNSHATEKDPRLTELARVV